MTFLRKLRAVLSTAVTWGLAWAPLSLVPLGLVWLFSGQALTTRVFVTVMVSQGIVGAINGAVFAGILMAFGRRKRFESISMPWIAACGMIGGALFPMIVRSALFVSNAGAMPAAAIFSGLVTNAVIGAGFAALSLSFARRAPQVRAPDETPSLHGGAPAQLT